MRLTSILVLALSASPGIVIAQHGAIPAPTPTIVSTESRQFDFLIGQWEVIVTPKASTLAARVHGVSSLAGSWKAWSALDGMGIEDELRITDGSGNPRSLSHSVRVYDRGLRRWAMSNLDAYRGIFTPSTGEWKSGAMIVDSRDVNGEGKAYLARARFTNISQGAFRVVQERSYDNGTSWQLIQTTEAKRVAAVAPR